MSGQTQAIYRGLYRDGMRAAAKSEHRRACESREDEERFDKAYAESYARAGVDAQARCHAIITHPEAARHKELAVHLACETDLGVEACIAAIRSAVRASATISSYGPRQGSQGVRASSAAKGADVAGGLILGMTNDPPRKPEPTKQIDPQAIYRKFEHGAGPDAPKPDVKGT